MVSVEEYRPPGGCDKVRIDCLSIDYSCRARMAARRRVCRAAADLADGLTPKNKPAGRAPKAPANRFRRCCRPMESADRSTDSLFYSVVGIGVSAAGAVGACRLVARFLVDFLAADFFAGLRGPLLRRLLGGLLVGGLLLGRLLGRLLGGLSSSLPFRVAPSVVAPASLQLVYPPGAPTVGERHPENDCCR